MPKSMTAIMTLSLLCHSLAAQTPPRLQGAWQLIQITTTGPQGTTNGKPLPSLYLFTRRHYSLVSENGDAPRTTVRTDSSTREQLVDILRFSAQGGTYDVSGNQVTFHRIAALFVPNMAPGNFRTDTFRLQGDTLWLTTKSSQAGPDANPTTVKLRRVE